MKSLKKQWDFNKYGYLQRIPLGLFFYLVGIFMVFIITMTEPEPGEAPTYASLGTFLYLTILGMMLLFIGILGFRSSFYLNLSMSGTRKGFLFPAFLVELAANLFFAMSSIPLYQLEITIYRHIYPTYQNEWNPAHYKGLPIPILLLIGALFLTSVSFFAGAAILKYEKKAFWIFWAIYMFCFCLLPGILSRGDNFLGKIGQKIFSTSHLPGNTPFYLVPILIALSLFFILSARHIVYNESVK